MSNLPAEKKVAESKPALMLTKVSEHYIKIRDLNTGRVAYYPRVHGQVHHQAPFKTATQAMQAAAQIDQRVKTEVARLLASQESLPSSPPVMAKARWWERLRKWLTGWLAKRGAVQA